MSPAHFLSDLHLAPERPADAAAFRAWARGPARGASAVYVLGDLFDSWLGDEQLADPFSGEVVGQLAGVARAGVPVHVMHGNRDFLLGEKFGRAAGAAMLPDSVVVQTGGVPTLLLHGDTLCTDDVDYQRYRAWIRDPARQRKLLSLPWPVRRGFAAWMRRKSRRASLRKGPEIMDVNAGAVVDAMRAANVARLIHGHTHRPATHAVDVDGRHGERHVLPDWHGRAAWLEIDAGGATRHELDA